MDTDDEFLIFEFNGEGLTHNCSNNNSGVFQIEGVLDTVEITTRINNNGYITEIGPAYVVVEGPYVSFDYSFNCDSALVYSFESLMLGATSFEWDFGDGNTDAINVNPIHEYASSGDYTIQLNATNNVSGCSYNYSQIVKVRNIQASLVLEDTLCVDSYLLDVSQSTDVYSPIDKPYFWYKNGQPIGYKSDDFNILVSEGDQSFKLVVRDVNYCTDTLEKTIVGLQPHAYFNTDITGGCSPLTSQFADTSHTLYGIMDRFWVIEGNTVSNDSIASYEFTNVGNYNIELTIVDSIGCSNSITKFNHIHVANPEADISANDYTICEGEEITFSTTYNTADSLVWYIDTNRIVTLGNTSVSATFDQWGDYNASIVVWKSLCSDSNIINSQIHVQEANADFSASDTISDCYPADITFDFIGENPDHVMNWEWTFGDGNAGSIFEDTVRYNYGHPANYTVSLSTTTSYGCSAFSTFDITVNGPDGDLDIYPLDICYGESVEFNVFDLDSVGFFILDYGDGYTIQDTITSNHTYNNQFSGDIHPTLILYSDRENPNKCKVDKGRHLNVHRIVADFNIEELTLDDDTLKACHPFDGHFVNTSTGANQFTWNFGNGTISNDESTFEVLNNFSFNDPVEYNVNLSARYSVLNCIVDTNVTITVLPVPNIDLHEDSVICLGDVIQINVDGNSNAILSWYPEELDEDLNIWSPTISPEIETEYVATLNLNRCINKDTIVIKIQDELDVEWSMDTTVIIGQSAPMFAVTNQNSSVPQWFPNYELTCDTCMYPVATPLESTTYVFEVSDTLGCITYREEIYIEVDKQYKVNLPTAFSPNSDGVNDIVYVEGWGIDELLEYRIFNRWGDEVYFTADITEGWDGTYRGSLQNIDSYAYRVRALMFSGQVITKEGTITLLR